MDTKLRSSTCSTERQLTEAPTHDADRLNVNRDLTIDGRQ